MINIEKAKEEFGKYRNLFDKENKNIERKFIHTMNVMDLCEIIAKNLNLNEEEIELAKLIGLLHDIARFEEYKNTKEETMFITSVEFNHANRGIEILKANNFIRKFVEDSKFDDIIFTAISNHNKNKIEDNLSEKELLYCKILRDADKLDILQLAVTTYWKNELDELSKETINKEMFIEFCKQNTIDASKIKEKNQLDKLIKTLALIFDIQYKVSFEILKERDYFNKIIARFYFTNEQTKKRILEMKEIGNKFINSNI